MHYLISPNYRIKTLFDEGGLQQTLVRVQITSLNAGRVMLCFCMQVYGLFV